MCTARMDTLRASCGLREGRGLGVQTAGEHSVGALARRRETRAGTPLPWLYAARMRESVLGAGVPKHADPRRAEPGVLARPLSRSPRGAVE